MLKVFDKIIKSVNKGDTLSVKVKKNIILTAIFRGATILISFILYRITFLYLDDLALFGVWLTILSIISWIHYFDIGLGNGLRNKLSEALAHENYSRAKELVSTAYVVMSAIIICFLIIFYFFQLFIDWNSILNINSISEGSLIFLMVIIVTAYSIQFLLSLINSVSFAHQDSSIPALIGLILNISIIIGIIFFWIIGTSDIVILGNIYGLITVLILLISNIILFRFRYANLQVHIKYFRKKHVSSLLNLGFKFFVIQIAVLILFTSDNIIITQIFGPDYVVPYAVTFKLFSIFTILSVIVLTPLWSAYTNANAKKNYKWIKRALKYQLISFLLICLFIIITVFAAKKIIYVWMGIDLSGNELLIILMGVYTCISIWNNIFAYFLNGINRIKIQLLTAIISGSLNIPLSIILAKNFGMGVSGVILSTIICLSIFAVLGPIQTLKILKNYKY